MAKKYIFAKMVRNRLKRKPKSQTFGRVFDRSFFIETTSIFINTASILANSFNIAVLWFSPAVAV